MKRYLFLLAWISESEGSGYRCTDVDGTEDLYDQFMIDNNDVFAVEIFAPNKDVASAYGYQAAFFENYTANDTCSICIEIADDLKIPDVNKTINLAKYWS